MRTKQGDKIMPKGIGYGSGKKKSGMMKKGKRTRRAMGK